jgi:malonyl-CoA O-methyltransferase
MNCAKKTVRDNFSRRASSYDRHSSGQAKAALSLIKIAPENINVSSVLEVGCGTGTLTSLLVDKYPGARIKALDISRPMLREARERCGRHSVRFMNADIEKIHVRERFDLVASNAALQWSEDLNVAAERIHSSLVPGGYSCVSVYGPGTYSELSWALSDVTGRKIYLPAQGFCRKGQVKKIFRRYFPEVEVWEKNIELLYPGIINLLRDIHLSGVRGQGAGEGLYLGAGLLRRAERVYKKKFGAIKSTHNIIYLKTRR